MFNKIICSIIDSRHKKALRIKEVTFLSLIFFLAIHFNTFDFWRLVLCMIRCTPV